MSGGYSSLEQLNASIVECRRCPRLVEWRERVALEKRASFRDDPYWGKPVPGFGDPAARLIVIGLAPAAHGANRTGRMFTGDRSGDWLYRAMHRAGFASQPTAVARQDGLELRDAYVTSAVHCAPPANKPAVAERDACAAWLDEELRLLARMRVVVCLGQFGYHAAMRALAGRGLAVPRPRVRFGHGVAVTIPDGPDVICSYHPSQQNTFTGKLTEAMFDSVFSAAAAVISGDARI